VFDVILKRVLASLVNFNHPVSGLGHPLLASITTDAFFWRFQDSAGKGSKAGMETLFCALRTYTSIS
jgi:hypothetical protein